MNEGDLEVHLQNHWTAATAGVDFAERIEDRHRGTDVGNDFAEIAAQVRDDRSSLRQIMEMVSVRPGVVLPLVARVFERLGRLKPNGRLLHRSPVSDILELEAFRAAVTAKGAGWDTLVVLADTDPRLPRDWLEQLSERAFQQAEAVAELQREVAAVRNVT